MILVLVLQSAQLGMHVQLMISLIFPPTHTAGKVNFSSKLSSISHSIGDNFSIPCNIEVGASTAQTGYTLTIYRHIFYDDNGDSSSPLPILRYQNNIDPSILSVESTARDSTSYRFYSSNLTLSVENFSVPSPQNVRIRGVKFICEFSVINQGKTITATTTTAVIPGFCKFITIKLHNYMVLHAIL